MHHKFVVPLKIGEIITNRELMSIFRCAMMGGMRRSKATNTLVLISDHTKMYDDKWYGEELHYTGMGKVGDQELKSQNRTLAESGKNGVAVHLFEVFDAREYTYEGEVELAGTPYQEEQLDDDGNPRKVWMFPLRRVRSIPS